VEPVSRPELITRADVPVFSIVKVVTTEVPVETEPTLSVPVEAMLDAPFNTFISAPVAIPVRLMMYGFSSVSFVTIVKILVKVPTVVGLNVTVKLELAPAATVSVVSDVE
jgi:hypothetical protein